MLQRQFVDDKLKRNLHIMSSSAVDCRDVLTPVHNGAMINDRSASKPCINGSNPTGLIDQVSSDDSGSTVDRLV